MPLVDLYEQEADFWDQFSAMKKTRKSAKTPVPELPVAVVHPAQQYHDRIQVLEKRHSFFVDTQNFQGARGLRVEIGRLQLLADQANAKEEKRVEAERQAEIERMTPRSDTCAMAPRPLPPQINFESGTLAYVLMGEDEFGYKRLVIHEAELTPTGFTYTHKGSYAVPIYQLVNLKADHSK